MPAEGASGATGPAAARPEHGRSPVMIAAALLALALLGGAIWLAIARGPALFLDLAKLPWCG